MKLLRLTLLCAIALSIMPAAEEMYADGDYRMVEKFTTDNQLAYLAMIVQKNQRLSEALKEYTDIKISQLPYAQNTEPSADLIIGEFETDKQFEERRLRVKVEAASAVAVIKSRLEALAKIISESEIGSMFAVESGMTNAWTGAKKVCAFDFDYQTGPLTKLTFDRNTMSFKDVYVCTGWHRYGEDTDGKNLCRIEVQMPEVVITIKSPDMGIAQSFKELYNDGRVAIRISFEQRFIQSESYIPYIMKYGWYNITTDRPITSPGFFSQGMYEESRHTFYVERKHGQNIRCICVPTGIAEAIYVSNDKSVDGVSIHVQNTDDMRKLKDIPTLWQGWFPIKVFPRKATSLNGD